MKLEYYIRKNRKMLDVEKVDEDFLWEGISKSMQPQRKQKRISVIWFISSVAASVIITLMVVRFWPLEPKQQLIFVNIDPNLAKQEVELKSQIEEFTKQINLANVNLNELPTSQNDLQYIDDLIEKYTADLKRFGPNQRLIESLMDLYNKKILLLQRMLNEIEKSKNYETRKIDV